LQIHVICQITLVLIVIFLTVYVTCYNRAQKIVSVLIFQVQIIHVNARRTSTV